MSSADLPPNFSETQSNAESMAEVAVSCAARWQVYHRLQSLGIDCRCASFQPLLVNVRTPIEAIQLWCVVNQVVRTRRELAASLENSLQLPSYS